MEEGELVSSGSFRVDRKRALELLARFQLEDPRLFILPWLRCAAASGATELSLAPSYGSLELRFDGLPFTGAELADPYACLFEEDAPALRRNRELALGLLALLRLEPASVLIVSGPPRERVQLTVESLERERMSSAPGQDEGTVIRVEQGGLRVPVWGSAADSALARGIALCRLTVRSTGSVVPVPDPPAGPWLAKIESRFLRGWAAPPEDLGGTSFLEAHALGVRVGRSGLRGPKVAFSACLNDDRFRLNASQSAVVQDEIWAAAVRRAERAAQRLLLRALGEQAARMAAAAGLLKEGWALERWRESFGGERTGAREPAPGIFTAAARKIGGALGSLRERREALLSAARFTDWARRAAMRLLRDPRRDRRSPLRAALWDAPLLFDLSGAPLSLSAAGAERERLGYLPVSPRRESGAKLDLRPVWLAAPRDVDLLSAVFRSGIRDIGELLEDKDAAPGIRAGWGGFIAARAFSFPGGAGEAGLSALPHPSRARFQLRRADACAAILLHESPLRFDAVVAWGARSTPGSAEEMPLVVSAASDAALGLYRDISGQYDCWRKTERAAVLRGHLLDFLVWGRGSDAGAEAWIETVPLFRAGKDWLDWRRLRLRGDSERALNFVSGPSPADGSLALDERLGRAALERLFPGAGVAEIDGGYRVVI